MQSTSTPFVAVSSAFWSRSQLIQRGRALVAYVTNAVTIGADAYAAAAQYDELSRLSSAELERRGIAAGDLHRHVFVTVTHHTGP